MNIILFTLIENFDGMLNIYISWLFDVADKTNFSVTTLRTNEISQARIPQARPSVFQLRALKVIPTLQGNTIDTERVLAIGKATLLYAFGAEAWTDGSSIVGA